MYIYIYICLSLYIYIILVAISSTESGVLTPLDIMAIFVEINSEGLFTWRWGTPDRSGNMWRSPPFSPRQSITKVALVKTTKHKATPAKALWRKLEPLFSFNKKALRFERGQMRFHQRANRADQKQ